MRIFGLPEIPTNVQKCLLPDCSFVQKNYGRCCLIDPSRTRQFDRGFLVKIDLCQFRNIGDSVFIDGSVFTLNFTNCASETLFHNFKVLKKAISARKIYVTVVFSDVIDVEKFSRRPNELKEVVGHILRMFTVCNGSVVTLKNFNENQSFGISLLLVNKSNISSCHQPYETDSNTEIVIEKCMSKLKFDQFYEQKKRFVDIGGYKLAYGILLEAIRCARIGGKGTCFSNRLLLVGPSGCGKTTLVLSAARSENCILLAMPVCKIISSRSGTQVIKDTFRRATLYSLSGDVCIILISNIHLLCGKRGVSTKRNLVQLMECLEQVENKAHLIVIGTSSKLADVDMELRKHKRFDEEVEMTVPSSEEREEIIIKMLSHWKIVFDCSLIKKLAKWTTGFVGGDLKLLLIEALMASNKKIKNDEPRIVKLLEHRLRQALTRVVPSGLKGAIGLCTANEASLAQVGGLERIKRMLDMAILRQLEHPTRFLKLGVPLTKGILLYGPPGCAKTTIVKALAKESCATFLATSAAELYSPYVGDAEKRVEQLFAKARTASPAIIFIDEIDAIVGSRDGDRERGVQERILSTLLVEMDGVSGGTAMAGTNSLGEDDSEGAETALNGGVIVIGATNRPQALDDALIRPGRFDKMLYLPPPDEEQRLRILKTLTSAMALDGSVDLVRLSKLTAFYSGADLKNLCRESGLYALSSTSMGASRIEQIHFEHVIGQLKPSLNDNIISSYEIFNTRSKNEGKL